MKKFFADRRNIVFATVVSILLIALTVLTAAAVVQQKKELAARADAGTAAGWELSTMTEADTADSVTESVSVDVSASDVAQTVSDSTQTKPRTKAKTAEQALVEDKEDNPLYRKYDEMNRQYPIEDGSTWVFYSNNPQNIEPHISFPSDALLAVYYFKVDADLHTDVWYEYYAPLDTYKGEYSQDMVRNIQGKAYVWQMTSMVYEGGCFPCMDGTVDIELRCYDDHGAFLTDELRFWREDENTLRLMQNNGEALYLQPGDTFRR